jgi:hypothetical protein
MCYPWSRHDKHNSSSPHLGPRFEGSLTEKQVRNKYCFVGIAGTGRRPSEARLAGRDAAAPALAPGGPLPRDYAAAAELPCAAKKAGGRTRTQLTAYPYI